MVDLGVHPHYADQVKAYIGMGCAACAGGGLKGRVAVHEILKIYDPVRNAIIANSPHPVIKAIAMQDGMRSLRQSALSKMVAGLVPAAEVTASTAPDKDKSKNSGSVAA